MKPQIYHNDTYNFTVYYFIGCDSEAVLKYTRKNFNYEFDIDGDGQTVWDDSGNFILWLKNAKDHEALAHESVHLANRVLYLAGVKPSFVNDEPLAYLVGCIFRNGVKK